MEYEEFVRNIAKAGLSLKDFAHLIKANPNSLTNYKAQNKVPKNMFIIAALLGELVDKGIAYHVIFNKIDISSQKPRNMKPTFTKKNEIE